MSTAILISGQLRTFAQCWPTQRWHVLRHFDDPHFFITVQKPGTDEAFEALTPLLDEFGHDRVHVDLRTDPDLSAHLTPELTRAYHQAPYTNAAPAHQLLLQHWYQSECWKFFQSITTESTEHTEKTNGSDSVPSVSSVVKSQRRFDTIIRLRADMFFHSFTPPQKTGYFFNQCFSPWWGGFGGANDRFAVMGAEAAGAYFGVWDHIPALLAAGCPFHPETLLAATLEAEQVEHHRTLRTEFSTLRPGGQLRHWTSEVLPCDMARAA